MYGELPVAPAVSAVVEAVWHRRVTPGAGDARIVPDGCTDLMWVDGTLLVAGPDTRVHWAGDVPGSRYVAVRFRPGAGPAVLGVPGHALRDARVELAALWPAATAARLAERIGTAADPAAQLQSVVAERLRHTGGPAPAVAAVTAYQLAGDSVAATARATGWSERQLHRLCLAAFGYGPATLRRILRFRRALGLARAGLPPARVAASAGYADQSHLAREVRALAGVPLRALLAGRPG